MRPKLTSAGDDKRGRPDTAPLLSTSYSENDYPAEIRQKRTDISASHTIPNVSFGLSEVLIAVRPFFCDAAPDKMKVGVEDRAQACLGLTYQLAAAFSSW